jgi:hypothetical protein
VGIINIIIPSACSTKMSSIQAVMYRPNKAQDALGRQGSQFSIQLVNESCRFAVLRTGRLCHQYIILVLISVRGRIDPNAIVQSGELCQSKIPIKPLGIKYATFRIVSQSLNKLRHGVPGYYRNLKLQ